MKRNKMIAAIRRLRGAAHSAVVEEYIAEAEHQDGKGYWDQFPTVRSLLEDFDLYLEILEECKDDKHSGPTESR